MPQFRGGPYRRRTWIRTLLPHFLIDLGVASKGKDCEAAGGEHEWYNMDNENSGCYHCEVDRAAEAYIRALGCPNVHADSVRLNQAYLAERRGDFESALDLGNQIEDSELAARAAWVRVNALRAMERTDDALSLANEVLAKTWNEESNNELASIAAMRGRFVMKTGHDTTAARQSTLKAIRDFGSNQDLLALLRDIDNRYSKNALYFRMLLHAAIPADHPLYEQSKGYIINCDVVDETPDQALKWVEELEAIGSPGVPLEIEESEVLEKRPDEPIGVYWKSGRVFYEDENDK